jgi:ankyrin repeat protein
MFSNFGPWFFGISRLCNACKNGDLDQVKQLATKHNINQRGWLGWAPLHKAAESGCVNVVRYILENAELNADVNIRDLENHTPIHCCVGVKETPQHLQTLEVLLAKGGDPNAEDDGKYTALHLAVLNNNVGCVKLLLKYGANIDAQNEDKYTALHTAYRYELCEIRDLLLQHGADTTIRDAQGRTPQEVAPKKKKPPTQYLTVSIESTSSASNRHTNITTTNTINSNNENKNENKKNPNNTTHDTEISQIAKVQFATEEAGASSSTPAISTMTTLGSVSTLSSVSNANNFAATSQNNATDSANNAQKELERELPIVK